MAEDDARGGDVRCETLHRGPRGVTPAGGGRGLSFRNELCALPEPFRFQVAPPQVWETPSRGQSCLGGTTKAKAVKDRSRSKGHRNATQSGHREKNK